MKARHFKIVCFKTGVVALMTRKEFRNHSRKCSYLHLHSFLKEIR